MRKFCFFLSLFLSFTVIARAQTPIDSAQLKSLEVEASNFAKAGNYDTAATLAKHMIAMGVHDSSTYFMTAIVLTLDGKKDEGKRYYDTAIAKGYDPNTQIAMMLGFKRQKGSTEINIDSAFAAAHVKALEDSKQLPKNGSDRKLFRLFLEDQGERNILVQDGIKKAISSGIALRMVKNDSGRRAYVYSILPRLKHTIATADLEEGGLILQHGNDTADYWNAHELALRAVHLGDSNARQLAAITMDRYLVEQGKPQLYGTQSFIDEKTGELELYPVDPSVTDAERAKWDEPPLKDQLKRTQAMYEK